MRSKKRNLRAAALMIIALLLCCILLPCLIPTRYFGFARLVTKEERTLRLTLVDTAVSWYGAKEGTDAHRAIIDLYNTQDPLPVGYRMTYSDAWCAGFVTAAALESGLTERIPPECSCPRQVLLFQDMGCWQEEDTYIPLPGDVIYYDWNLSFLGDCTGEPDHVGIVVGTFGPFIRVMEGNKRNRAEYRTILHTDWRIRGYGLPNYAGA